mgnify:CR=1 FL=1
MDLNKLAVNPNDLIDVPLLFTDDGDPESGFKVVGADSDDYQAVDRLHKVNGVKKTARRGRGIDAKTDTGANELIDVLAKREDAIMAACIKEIYGFTSNGQPAALSKETLDAIFKARPTWRNKVLSVIESDQVFIKASSAG